MNPGFYLRSTFRILVELYDMRIRKFFRANGLSLVLLGLFLSTLLGQSLAGWISNNEEQIFHHRPQVDYWAYLTHDHFLEAVFENWESEFLQMGAFVILTIFLRQKGSPESKSMDEKDGVEKVPVTADSPWPVRRGGWVLLLYQNSLSIALLLLFVASFVLHLITGTEHYNDEILTHGRGRALSAWEYLQHARFWQESLQNWQSEFLSMGALVVLGIFLRQKDSPESKEVAMPHSEN